MSGKNFYYDLFSEEETGDLWEWKEAQMDYMGVGTEMGQALSHTSSPSHQAALAARFVGKPSNSEMSNVDMKSMRLIWSVCVRESERTCCVKCKCR